MLPLVDARAIICAQPSSTHASTSNHDLKIPSARSITLSYGSPPHRVAPQTQGIGRHCTVAGLSAATFVVAFATL